MARRSKARADEERPAAPYFEVCVAGFPVSAQAKNRDRLAAWRARVRAAAIETWPDGVPPLEGDVVLHVTHYCELAVGDTDNLKIFARLPSF